MQAIDHTPHAGCIEEIAKTILPQLIKVHKNRGEQDRTQRQSVPERWQTSALIFTRRRMHDLRFLRTDHPTSLRAGALRHRVRRLAPPAAPVKKQLPESPPDHPQFCPGGPPTLARQVTHAYLPDTAAGTLEPVEQFGVNHRPARFERIAMQEIRAQKFKRTIDIMRIHMQGQPDDKFPAPGVESAYQCVLTIQAIADDCIICIDQRQKVLQLADIELPI